MRSRALSTARSTAAGVFRVGAQIAVAQIVRGKQRRAAGEIDDEVAARHRAVARHAERQHAARGGQRRRVVVDHKLERAEMSLGGADRAFDDRKLGDARGLPDPSAG